MESVDEARESDYKQPIITTWPSLNHRAVTRMEPQNTSQATKQITIDGLADVVPDQMQGKEASKKEEIAINNVSKANSYFHILAEANKIAPVWTQHASKPDSIANVLMNAALPNRTDSLRASASVQEQNQHHSRVSDLHKPKPKPLLEAELKQQQVKDHEPVRVVAGLLVDYRYDTVQKESQLAATTSPGNFYFRIPLRPQQVADGVPDYQIPEKHSALTEALNADGRAEYIVPRKKETSNSAPTSEVAESGSAGSKNHVANTSGQSRTPVGSVYISGNTDSLNLITEEIVTDASLASSPVLESDGTVGPNVVLDPIVEPESAVSIKSPSSPSKRVRKYRGFSGFLTLGNRQFNAKGYSATTGVSYKPIKDSYFFLRSSGTWKFEEEEYLYNWGVGYDDWHPGTFAFQINHWGPLRPGDYLDFDNAIASATYKFNKSSFMKDHNLSSSVTLSQKISGDPVFSWSNSWSPVGKWFVRSTISQPIKEGDLSWSYGFGYANYSPFTFSFEYNNWGYNKAFHGNFVNNGSLSFTYRWRY